MGIDHTASVEYERRDGDGRPVPLAPFELVEGFLRYGWLADNGASHVQYAICEVGGYPACLARPLSELAAVLSELEAAASSQKYISLMVIWPETEYGGTLCLKPKLPKVPGTLLFSAEKGIRKPHPQLGGYPFVDYNWYTQRIVEPLRRMNVIVRKIDWAQT